MTKTAPTNIRKLKLGFKWTIEMSDLVDRDLNGTDFKVVC